MQSIEVSKLPLVIHNNQPCRIYKLIVRLKQPKHVSLKNCQETLRNVFLRALEDAIERHVALVSRINGIKSDKKSKAGDSAEGDDASVSNVDDDDGGHDEDDDDDDGDHHGDEDGDVDKRKRQSTDSIEYEDVSEEEIEEEEASSDLENEGDKGKKVAENISDDETDVEHSTEEQQEENTDKTNPKPSEEFVERKFDRAIFVEVKDLNLEVRFRFTNEPELLLAEV